MKAALLTAVARLEVRDVPAPRPARDEVLLRMAAVGLCGTDFHIFSGRANYHADERGVPVPLEVSPQVLGHEIAAVVEEVGAGVRDLHPGDRVVVDQGRNCMTARRAPLCEYCASGHSHQCAWFGEHGITGLQGGLAEFLAVAAVNAIRIESDLDLAEAAVTEPLGCIVHTCDALLRTTARYQFAGADAAGRVRSTLVTGAGPAGLLFIQYLRNVLQYDGRLFVSEPDARKRALAAGYGAEPIDPGTADVTSVISDLTDGRRVECLIEASGAASVFERIPGLLRKQGTLVLYGHGHSGVDIGVISNVQYLEPTWVSPIGASGGFDPDGRPQTYRRALRLIESGRVEAAPWITHRYHSLEEVPRAFASEHRAPEYVKGVVTL